MNKQKLVLKRTFNISKRGLFEAWSQPKIMGRWLFATKDSDAYGTVENSFVTDGTYKLVMHMNSGSVEIHGEYIKINRYNFLAFTWNSPVVKHTLVSLDFKALSPNRTELTLTHQFLPNSELAGQHETGWQTCFDNLETLLGSVEGLLDFV